LVHSHTFIDKINNEIRSSRQFVNSIRQQQQQQQQQQQSNGHGNGNGTTTALCSSFNMSIHTIVRKTKIITLRNILNVCCL